MFTPEFIESLKELIQRNTYGDENEYEIGYSNGKADLAQEILELLGIEY